MWTREQVEAAVKAKGYRWFEGDNYDLNIVGIRNSAPGKAVTNVFDDWMTVSYKIDGAWQFQCWPCTTDPGTKAVKQFSNPNGVARVIPGQYRGMWSIGMHKQQYKALVQVGKVKVWRDSNRDMSFDETHSDEGLFGINCHRSNPTTESEYVENWSEGCQVFKRVREFNSFMKIAELGAANHGPTFTYTLIESKDIAS